jgi:hypothetical protein
MAMPPLSMIVDRQSSVDSTSTSTFSKLFAPPYSIRSNACPRAPTELERMRHQHQHRTEIIVVIVIVVTAAVAASAKP